MTPILLLIAIFCFLLAWKRNNTLHERIYPDIYFNEDFPEDRFPAKDERCFLDKKARGYEIMVRSGIIICGITKDDAETLSLAIRRIEKTGQLFADYRVVIFENDSTDQTLSILREWETGNPSVTILSESLRSQTFDSLSRFERLACCRNRYLDHIEHSPEFGGYEYLMVVDMDLRGGWSYDGIASTFAETGWDAVASNSIAYHYLRRTYYDTLALKPPSILKQNWFSRLAGEGWQFRRNDPLIPVESAFGGLCLYRRDPLRGRRYHGLSETGIACEHHSLNIDNSLRFFLNPSQITIAGTQISRETGNTPNWKRWLSRLLLNW